MNDPAETLTSYVRAFETQRADAVVPFYQLPCTFIRPDGVWVVSDRDTALTLAAHLVEHAQSQGYARTQLLNLKVRSLAAELSMLDGVFVRYDKADGEIGRFGFTYVLRSDSGEWKIVVAIAHDADPVESRR